MDGPNLVILQEHVQLVLTLCLGWIVNLRKFNLVRSCQFVFSGSGSQHPGSHSLSILRGHEEVGGLHPAVSQVAMSASMGCASVAGPHGEYVGSYSSEQAANPSCSVLSVGSVAPSLCFSQGLYPVR